MLGRRGDPGGRRGRDAALTGLGGPSARGAGPPRPLGARRSACDCSGLAPAPEPTAERVILVPAAPASRYLSRRSSRVRAAAARGRAP